MDFYGELADEVGADDWLIPAHEISNCKLIKRTTRFNIYKADWFGDVLVYKPSETCNNNSPRLNHHQSAHHHNAINLDFVREFSGKLLGTNAAETTSLSGSSDYEYDHQTDSAYSSISSTPQYHTKSTSTEFEFPADVQLSSLSTDYLVDQFQADTTPAEAANKGSSNVVSPTPVLLNKDSFNYSCRVECSTTSENDHNEPKENCTCSGNSWSDLNELRLIAHENFMLFMGASIAQEGQRASLVMQMNHPKAATVYNLLHKAKLELNNSPIDRFFACKRQQISLDVKLRVCQQVSNAMAYLHDKNIVHGRLTSANIHVELNQRVRISLIDSDEHSLVGASWSSHESGAHFHLPALTYLSPEFIKTITIISTTPANHQNNCCEGRSALVNFDNTQLTKAADVFSFGTFLFELFRESFPFAEQVQDISWLSKTDCLKSPLFSKDSTTTAIKSPAESVFSLRPNWNGDIKLSASELIYQIGSGNVAAKNLSDKTNDKNSRFPLKVRKLVEECWSMEAQLRPAFKQLAAEFLTLQPVYQ